MSEKSLTMVLPLPQPLLSDNVTRRMHWATKGRHVKKQRADAGYVGQAVMTAWCGAMNLRWASWQHVRIDIEVRPRPRMKRLDDDNFWAAMKPYRDGLADVGLVANDKQFVIGTLKWSDKRTSELLVTLTRLC